MEYPRVKLLSSMQIKRVWDSDLVRIVEEQDNRTTLNPWYETKLELSHLYPNWVFGADYIQLRYFQARSIPSVNLDIRADFGKKLKSYLDPVLLSQRLHALQYANSLRDRHLLK